METKRRQNGNMASPDANGKPVNLTTGNMFLQHVDYAIGGLSSELSLVRTYNSQSDYDGLFGLGWYTGFEETLTVINDSLLSVNFEDGHAVYFRRIENTSSFKNANFIFKLQASRLAGAGEPSMM